MNIEWQDLPTMRDVAYAQDNWWEIRVFNCLSKTWVAWNGKFWDCQGKYHGHPKQPKKDTVTSECYRHRQYGWITHENNRKNSTDWQRFPAGDITGEVEE
jgi:hypothetical protein